jgi:hypothetical protein
LIEDYFHEIAAIIKAELSIQGASMAYDKRTPHIGFLRGSLYFSDGSVLHVREYVSVQYDIERYMYVYQYQDRDGILIFRYDNSRHFPQLSTSPHHKHDGSESNVINAIPTELAAVLGEIRSLLKLK